MAVYERYEEDPAGSGYLVTNLKEHAIYGSDRLGLDLNGVELSRLPIGEGDEEDPTGACPACGNPSGRHALVIGEILYDSQTTGDDFPTGKEYSEGGAEFSEFTELSEIGYKSGMGLDLSDYTLRLGEDSLVLSNSLPAGERVIIGFGADMAHFQRITVLAAEYADAVNLQSTFGLPDRGGVLRVTHASGNELDALNYSKVLPQAAYSSLATAKNPYIADSLMDSLAMRNPLYSVSRETYGGAAEGSTSAEGAGVGISDPGVEPEPSGRAVVGSFTLWRGRKVYELKNHLGNVLAVVSDVKIGVGPTNVQPSLINYYTADPSSSLRAGVVEMSDYEPFGMLLAKRHWVSGEGYRFGFQAQEGDDEWSGEGNMLAFKYRVHDARLGRFLSIDPLAPEYPWNSSYAFAENRVMDGIDLEGGEWLSYITPKEYSDSYGFVGNANVFLHRAFAGFMNSIMGGLQHGGEVICSGGEVLHQDVQNMNEQLDHDWQRMVNHPQQFFQDMGTKMSDPYQWGSAAGCVVLREITGGPFGSTRMSVFSGGPSYVQTTQIVARKSLWQRFQTRLRAIGDSELRGMLREGRELRKMQSCFAAGTLVKTPHGDVPIEEIEIGDTVFGWNELTELVEQWVVTAVFVHQTDSILELEIGGETISTTPNHPFWLKEKWVRARELNEGDSLMQISGEYFVIEDIDIKAVETLVYNFTVDSVHTYFVGMNGVLVHNKPKVKGVKSLETPRLQGVYDDWLNKGVHADIGKGEIIFDVDGANNWVVEVFEQGKRSISDSQKDWMVSQGYKALGDPSFRTRMLSKARGALTLGNATSFPNGVARLQRIVQKLETDGH